MRQGTPAAGPILTSPGVAAGVVLGCTPDGHPSRRHVPEEFGVSRGDVVAGVEAVVDACPVVILVYLEYTTGMTVTTIKVSAKTRDRVKALSDSEHRTADQIINVALDTLEHDRRCRQMREESRAALADPADQDAIRRVRADLEDLGAW